MNLALNYNEANIVKTALMHLRIEYEACGDKQDEMDIKVINRILNKGNSVWKDRGSKCINWTNDRNCKVD